MKSGKTRRSSTGLPHSEVVEKIDTNNREALNVTPGYNPNCPNLSKEFETKGLKYIEDLLAQGADKGLVASGLAGLDSDRAWKLRSQLLAGGADKGWVARSLAGLDSDRAWELRSQLLAGGADKSWVALGVFGDRITCVWQLGLSSKVKEYT